MNVDEFLHAGKIMRLATVGSDGTPHVVPVWYSYDGEKFRIGTNTRTVKARNVKANGRVAYCIDEGVRSPQIKAHVGHGTASMVTGSEVGRMAEEILLRYFESMDNGRARELYDNTDCIIEIVPDGSAQWAY